jgi:diguanylate cyclase (GGDEF)-like protein/PAS domain S-box-containing protein
VKNDGVRESDRKGTCSLAPFSGLFQADPFLDEMIFLPGESSLVLSGEFTMECQEDFYKALLDSIQDGIYFVDTERTITYWNRGAERITGYPASLVTGSSCAHNILVHVDSEGRQLCLEGCPLARTISDGEPRTAEVFFHHRDGHRVPVAVAVSPIRNAEGTVIGAVEIFHENRNGNIDPQVLQELKNAALLDPLTGLANRRFLEMKISACFEEFYRHGVHFGILFADIDRFKSINDTFGHLHGDAVLKMVGKTLDSNIRKSDLAGRWGGEEFILVVTYVSEKQMRVLAEKIRMLVEQSFLVIGSDRVAVTITIGATLALREDTPESLLERADRLLYAGKTAGRNRVMYSFSEKNKQLS